MIILNFIVALFLLILTYFAGQRLTLNYSQMLPFSDTFTLSFVQLRHRYICEEYEPELKPGRRPSIVYPPREGKAEWDVGNILKPSPSDEFAPGYEMILVNRLRERVKAWQQQGYPGVTRTTLDLLH
ncbi:MAG: hypothetical protein WBG70_16930 [Spirulinaceae cyanobacterium]